MDARSMRAAPLRSALAEISAYGSVTDGSEARRSMSGTRVVMVVPRGSAIPHSVSITLLLPADWLPTTTTPGTLMVVSEPISARTSSSASSVGTSDTASSAESVPPALHTARCSVREQGRR